MRQRRASSRPWGIYPLLAALLAQTGAIGAGALVDENTWAEELHSSTLANVTTAGFENNPAITVFWAALYASAVIYLWRARQKLRRGPETVVLAVSLVLMSSGLLTSGYPAKVAVNVAHLIGGVALGGAAAVAIAGWVQAGLSTVAKALGVGVALQLAFVAAAPNLAIDSSGWWMGATGNRNSFAAFAALAAVANAASFIESDGARSRRHLVWVLVSIVGLAGAGSVTSILAALGGGSVVIWTWTARAVESASRRAAARTAIVAVVTAIGCAVLMIGDWSALADRVGRTSDVSGRTPLWELAVGLIGERPLLGWSFDDNATVIAKTYLPHTTFHNGYLDVAVRGGVVALLLLGTAVIATTARVLRRKDPAGRCIRTSYLAFVVFLAIHNMAEVSLFAGRNAVWLYFIFVAATSLGAEASAAPQVAAGALAGSRGGRPAALRR